MPWAILNHSMIRKEKTVRNNIKAADIIEILMPVIPTLMNVNNVVDSIIKYPRYEIAVIKEDARKTINAINPNSLPVLQAILRLSFP